MLCKLATLQLSLVARTHSFGQAKPGMATENPAFADGQDKAAAGGVDIEAALKGGTMTVEQVVLLQVLCVCAAC